MSESRDILLLEKFLAGTATPEEEAWLREWADTTLGQPGTLDLLRASWELPKSPDPLLDREVRWTALQRQIAKSADASTASNALGDTHWKPSVETKSPVAQARLPIFGWTQRLPVAALSICVAAVLVAGGWFASHRSVMHRESADVTAVTTREYVTARGQRAIVQLPDGSTASLAPETKLRFSMPNGSGARRVELNGEAFFAVESNNASPFIVRAGNTVTNVLGTEFGVRWYADDQDVRIAVASGRVSVQTVEPASSSAPGQGSRESSSERPQSIILSANDITHVTANGKLITQRDVDLTPDLGWRTGQHVFRMVSASTIAAELSRSYDLNIQFADPELGRQLLTLSFATERESVMLDIFVSALLDARVQREGRTVTISRNAR